MKLVINCYSVWFLNSCQFKVLFTMTIALGVLLCVTGIATAHSGEEEPARFRVIPRPKVEKYDTRNIPLVSQGEDVLIQVSGSTESQAEPIQEGLALLSDRLDILGTTNTSLRKVPGNHHILIDICSEEELSAILRNEGVKEKLDKRRLSQTYYLRAQQSQAQDPVVTLQACSDLGLYYGLLTLCQLVDKDDAGRIVAPTATISDWPEIGIRLSKTSASDNELPMLRLFSDWMKVFKINMIGLQYHGGNSKAPEEPFPTNIEALCKELRDTGILETIVYFCPFRGGGENIKGYDLESFQKPGAYDLSKDADRKKYAVFLKWIMAQGAHGIEIDYNDWPGKGSDMESVINLVYDTLQEESPESRILFCPPFVHSEEGEDEITYCGNASPEMNTLLSKVPEKVWPLWTGTGGIVISELTDSTVEQWTRDAGRKPFFWLNRVGLELNKSFSRPVEEIPGLHAFHGEFLPENLNQLFEGIHFNAGLGPGYNNLGESFSAAALVYFASAADYIWNPHDWDAVESSNRAKRFVRVMQPLVEKRKLKE